jgi:hypothetical protein
MADAAKAGAAEEETEFVQELLKFPEVFVYRVPPLTSVQSGHRAETWGLEKPFATCSMKVMAKGDTIMLQLTNNEKQGQLVAACPIALTTEGEGQTLEYWLEAVKDSARYFVIRMVDVKSKKQALLGVGFRDRNSAFEFQEALDHHFRRVLRLRGITVKAQGQELILSGADHPDEDNDEDTEEGTVKKVEVKPAVDLSLKAPIKLNLKATKPSTASTSSAPFSIPTTTAAVAQTTSAATSAPKTQKPEDVDWGDFES